MENRLSKVPLVKVHADNILVSGKNDSEHFENLESVFEIIKNNGLRLKLKKCVFMQPEVEYLGFKINKQEVSLLKEKIKAMQSVSMPKNISELKPFLGLIINTGILKTSQVFLSHYTNSYVKTCDGNGEWNMMCLGKPKKC